jgi:hypothetical protein
MWVFIWDSAPSKIFVWDSEVSKVFVGDTQVRPSGWLPSEYQEVEYIQSSGSQYIDTGFAPNWNTELEFDFAPTSTSGYQGYFWSDYDWNNTTFQSYNDRLFSYWNQYWASWTYFVANTRYLLEFKSWTVRLNWNTIRTVSITTFTVPHSALICAVYRKAYNWISNYGSEKVYWLKLWDSWTLVRDFVPCYRKLDSVIWMYDLVNNVFYTNSWSWVFTKWPDV